MYAGRLVGSAPIADIITSPRHPYTRALIAALPSLETTRCPIRHPRSRTAAARSAAGLRLSPALPQAIIVAQRETRGTRRRG